jgi:LacI family transcriptional regulator
MDIPEVNKKTTIHDIAKMLNVTASTVSRAMKDHPRISKETKKAVNDMAEKLNYQPNFIASNLRTGKSNIMGVIVPRINRDFFSNVIAGIEDVAYEAGYSVLICQTHDNYEREKKHVASLINSRAEGIIASLTIETKDVSHFEKVKKSNIPLIFFDRVAESMDVSKILVDDYAGAYKVTEHLIKIGCKKIAHFCGPMFINVYRDRKRGYLDALEKHNFKIDTNYIIQNDLSIEAGKQDMERLMLLPNPPDAIFSSSDYSALGAILYLKEKNYKIPGQVAVAGFSNEKFTSLIDPGITTIEQHSKQIGNYIAKLFIEEISTKKENFIPRKTIITPELCIRASTLDNL